MAEWPTSWKRLGILKIPCSFNSIMYQPVHYIALFMMKEEKCDFFCLICCLEIKRVIES